MSTIDPVAARRERQTRRRPVIRSIVSGILLAAMFTAGSSWGHLALEGVDSAGAGLQVTAIVSSIAAWFAFLLFSIATFGSWRGGPYVLGLGLMLVGTGLIWPRLSEDVDLLALPGVLGAIFIGLGLLVWLLAANGRRVRRVRENRQRVVEQTGTHTVATVTNVPRGPSPSSRGLWGTVTFTFVDAAGTTRWVEKTLLIKREGDVKVGDTTSLWYDAAAPGDEDSIVVELARDNPLRMP